MSGERQTPLHDQHVVEGGKMVPFAGYSMPLEYSGILAEHRIVRTAAGIFDLSHMGEFVLTGENALSAIDRLVTNQVVNLEVGQARYTPMCYENGGIVDDLLVYRFDDFVLLVVNAANIDKDFSWIRDRIPVDVELKNASEDYALIALQGPTAQSILQPMTRTDLTVISYYHAVKGQVAGVPCIISRTGYTGEDGFEFYVGALDAVELWRALMLAGRTLGLCPIGLGARDTLRLEACFPLYGNDISEATTPIEAGLRWTVKLEGRTFVGSSVLAEQVAKGTSRRLVAFEMTERAIPRPHSPIVVHDQSVGEVTSGTFSPSFEKGIGMGYVPTESGKVGTELGIDIRGQMRSATVVKKPIYQRSS